MMELEAKGADKVAKILQEFAGSIPGVVAADLEKLGEEALELANSLTPVRTGYLQSRNQAAIEENKLVIFNDAPYASFVHNGTSRQEPQPFLGPVEQELESEAPGLFSADLARAYRAAKDRNAAADREL
jgi:HK97 gp10 family phage protein